MLFYTQSDWLAVDANIIRSLRGKDLYVHIDTEEEKMRIFSLSSPTALIAYTLAEKLYDTVGCNAKVIKYTSNSGIETLYEFSAKEL
jgi:hypothetical protein